MKKRKRKAAPVFTHAGINIRQLRPNCFQVDVFRDHKRERKCFDDLEKAKTHAYILGRKLENEGASALDLTPAQRMDATRALGILKGDASLEAAAQLWARQNARAGGLTVAALGERFVQAIRGAGCRETTIAERTQKIARLVKSLGDRPAASITKDDLTGWLDDNKLVGVTRDGYRRCYHAVFQYAVEEKIVDLNPVAAIKAFRADEKLPVPFTVEATHAIMAAAETYAPIMVPLLAVQFFAGLRPGEAMGLTWQAIDWAEKTVRVLPETSKMRRARHVDMNETLLGWMLRYRKASGPVGVSNQPAFAYYMTRQKCGDKTGLLSAAGITWIKDGPRKTFASMHYATYQDAAKLAAMLGHTGGLDVLFRHYRGLTKKTEAARYWQILPHVESKVIQFG
ncbi:MAG TPA: hypothetical protein DCS31_05880 [Candidatus Competibacteraceae bacterium]|jgi:integrase|nr:hypothetical protein [Candidatus Competibacteraceae bacterium]